MISGPGEPLLILSAHRGGSAEGAENTIHAFNKAVDLGMNLLEMDVHLSRDGQVVIAHDSELGRMCGSQFAGRNLEEYAFDELPPFQREIPMHLTAGAYRLQDDEEGRFSLLEDLFESHRDLGHNRVLYSIDLKSRSDELVMKTNALIVKY